MKRKIFILIAIIIFIFPLGSCFDRRTPGPNPSDRIIYPGDYLELRIHNVEGKKLYNSWLQAESVPILSLSENYKLAIFDLPSNADYQLTYDNEKIALSELNSYSDTIWYLIEFVDEFTETSITVDYYSAYREKTTISQTIFIRLAESSIAE